MTHFQVKQDIKMWLTLASRLEREGHRSSRVGFAIAVVLRGCPAGVINIFRGLIIGKALCVCVCVCVFVYMCLCVYHHGGKKSGKRIHGCPLSSYKSDFRWKMSRLIADEFKSWWTRSFSIFYFMFGFDQSSCWRRGSVSSSITSVTNLGRNGKHFQTRRQAQIFCLDTNFL